ncbi:MAG: hypothetical protein Q7R87_04565 [Nanoarchaeota archaeon]|nr:hypothetical protein [Nanoarchaeota archaeon]
MREDSFALERLLGVPPRGETVRGAPVTRPSLSPVKRNFDVGANDGDLVIGYLQFNYDTGEATFSRERKY